MPVTWDEARDIVQAHALSQGEYAGLPMPIHGARISLSEKHHRQEIDMATLGPHPGEEPASFTCTSSSCSDGMLVRNHFWSRRLGSHVWIIEEGGKIRSVLDARFALQLGGLRRWQRLLATFDAGQQAWDPKAEARALKSLAELLNEHQFGTYLTMGMFLEASDRSQCKYMFRKGYPTVVLQPSRDGNFRASVALCLHPLAYYEDTFAGGMVPTDDVIAHLLLMRADEPRFWRQANQHPIDRPESGV